ncbi:MAG: thiolase family protein [Chloroflexi bacterium]|nr:thiolase family protein [Chloroflexota bacterium]
MNKRVAIVSTGQTKYSGKRKDASFTEMAHEATERALNDANLTLADIDAVVFGSAPEAFEGVNWPDKWCVDATGAIGKPFMRIHTGGATGGSTAIAAVQHVASGMFNTVLAIAIERVSETPDAQFILKVGGPPLFSRDSSGFNIISDVAMETSRWLKAGNMSEWHMAKIASKNHANAMNNPFAHLRFPVTIEDVLASRAVASPLKLLDCCPRSDGACAIVVTSEEKAKRLAKRPAWVKGMGAYTRCFTSGEGALMTKEELEHNAVFKAYRMAGIDKPRKQIQVVEPYTPFSSTELMTYVLMGLCEHSEVARLCENGFGEMDGEIPFSPSGGVLCSNPIGATALVRVAEIALQIMGKADERQVPDVKIGVATGAGGSGGMGLAQFNTAMILGVEPN